MGELAGLTLSATGKDLTAASFCQPPYSARQKASAGRVTRVESEPTAVPPVVTFPRARMPYVIEITAGPWVCLLIVGHIHSANEVP